MKIFAHESRLAIAGMVAVAMLMTTAAQAQGQERFAVSFDNTPLPAVLQEFKRLQPDFAYTIAPGAESRVVTVALVDVTIDQALAVVLGQLNLSHVKRDGVYAIQEQAEQRVATVRGMPQYGAPVFAVKSAAPSAAPAAPQRAAEGVARRTTDERTDLPIRMLKVRYGDPALLAELFGGYAIYGDQAGMMGGTTGGIGGQRGAQRGGQRGAVGTARPATTGRGGGGGGYGAGRGGGGYGRAYGG